MAGDVGGLDLIRRVVAKGGLVAYWRGDGFAAHGTEVDESIGARVGFGDCGGG